MPRSKNWTAEEWETSRDIHAMLRFMGNRASFRRQRLFACGWCRQVWHRAEDPRSRNAVEVSERFADGLATVENLAEARRMAHAACSEEYSLGTSMGLSVSWDFCPGVMTGCLVAGRTTPPEERTAQLRMVRDIFGNPFRPVALDPDWLTDTVRVLATTVYDDRAFDRLPILADALQDAGCVDEQILTHCRGPGPHVRGCWVVDLLTGRV